MQRSKPVRAIALTDKRDIFMRSRAVGIGSMQAALVACGLMLALAPSPAMAQFVCVDGTLSAGGSTATVNGSSACGISNHATGQQSNAFGYFNTSGGLNSAAFGGNNTTSGDYSTAVGYGNNFQVTSGLQSTALGYNNAATGDKSTAVGSTSTASGTSSVAIGDTATASATNATAIGKSATAGFANSTAIGNGATVARANQQVFGTSTNTYTMAGITSAASASAQSGAPQIVTSDASGNLATSTLANLGLASSADVSGINSQLSGINSRLDDLTDRSNKAFTGVAMAFAMAGVPTVLPNENFVATVNWGGFQGSNGLALMGAMRLYDHVQLNGGLGVGLNQNLVGGRVGLRVGF